MENEPRPRYAIDSVDSALQLLMILRRDGRLTVSGAASELGVARSTAHRLISMLRYRHFVVQADDRSYRPGPMAGVVAQASSSNLADVAQSHLRTLVARTGETANLMVLDGARVRFLTSAESEQILKVGTRRGVTLPARLTSGGRALLAELSAERIVGLHPDLASVPGAVDRLLSLLVAVRRDGYATNFEDSETGVTAIGVKVSSGPGHAVAAVSISAPTARYRRRQILTLLPALQAVARDIEKALSETPLPQGT